MYSNEAKYFRELIRTLERELENLNKPDCRCDFTLSQCHALIEIGRTNSISLKELANILQVDASAMSRTVDSLVENQWVTRFTSSIDRRKIEIKLTEKGASLFNQIEKSMNDKFSIIFDGIPEDERVNVLHSLELITQAFHNQLGL